MWWRDSQSLTTYGVGGAAAVSLLLLLGRHLAAKFKDDGSSLDDKLQNNAFLATAVVQDLARVGEHISPADVKTLLQFAFTAAAGKPVNDRELMMEKVMAIVTKLPETSRARKRLTDILITGLWDSLTHPPLSFQGPKYQYRSADGSLNNVLIPDLGKAGMPYSRAITPQQRGQTQNPDPAALFDALMARESGKYRKNAGGLSVMLFYHATIIIHDIFRTNRHDPNKSDTSSYVDLAPLYGSSVEDQETVRAFDRGLLKPDTFFEERLLAQPPGVNALLVLYSRFHNYVADMLLKINEGGRFTLRPQKTEKDAQKAQKDALKVQDEDLFQTARLVTCGLYANIALHDYLRGLTNTHHSDSSWTMDPRFEINKGNPLKSEVARGIGNQVSTEFNLMYRFHSAVSERDEKWLEEFARDVLNIDDMATVTPRELLLKLQAYENSIKPDPSQREFAWLKRGKDGKFADADLVKVLHESMEDQAGAFGPQNVPKLLKVVEILGIKRAREWHTASLNEFRDFFGLARHQSFEDINPDPEIADLLRTFYDTPDDVEGYPGMWLEEAKPAMNPGSGVCLPYTVGRAVFSDAITLVRSDRFYTIDFTPANLTSWGLSEVAQDYKTLGGSVFYKLIQRGLPGWFPFNSLHVMQPMFTWETNKKIAEEIGTIGDYTLNGPAPPPKPKVVVRWKAAQKILGDSTNFAVPGLTGFKNLADGRDYSDFMLAGDAPKNVSQRQFMDNLLYRAPDFGRLVFESAFKLADRLAKTEPSYCGKIGGEERYQVDIIKDIAIPTLTHVLADVFSLDLKTEENPEGSYEAAALYDDLLTLWTWLFSNTDPAQAWNRRRKAREAAGRLLESTKTYLKRHLPDPQVEGMGWLQRVIHKLFHGQAFTHNHVKQGTLRWYGLQIASHVVQATGEIEKAAEILYICAVGGGGLPIGQFGECVSYFMAFDNTVQSNFSAMSKLSLANDLESDEKIEGYMMEAFRLSDGLKIIRIAKNDMTVDGVKYKQGDVIAIPVGVNGTSMDPEGFPSPSTFDPSRPKDNYILFGYGQHECIGKEISNKYTTAMLKVFSGFQRVKLNEGALKRIPNGLTEMYLSADGGELTPHPSTAKMTFSHYTRDPRKMSPPIYPTYTPEELKEMSKNSPSAADAAKSAGKRSQHDKDMALRICDLGQEMLHIDKGGKPFTETERSWVFASAHSSSSNSETEMRIIAANSSEEAMEEIERTRALGHGDIMPARPVISGSTFGKEDGFAMEFRGNVKEFSSEEEMSWTETQSYETSSTVTKSESRSFYSSS